jgi:hypothetical protein
MPQKLSHQGQEKFMVMSKGFAPSNPAEKSEELNKPKPISIEDLQTGFSNYFDDVPDTLGGANQTTFTQRHSRHCPFSGHSRSEWVGRHGKLWNQ